MTEAPQTTGQQTGRGTGQETETIPPRSSRLAHPLLFAWAILGVLFLLVQALLRLTPIAWEALSGELSVLQIISTTLWVVMNLYLEGYRGFQRRFVPRVVSRAHYLATRRTPPAVLLAPLFAMAYYGATKSARRSAWIVTTMVLLAIVVVRALPQPYRGLIDAGVVAGLSWGAIALFIAALRCALSATAPADPEVADPEVETDESSKGPGAYLSRQAS